MADNNFIPFGGPAAAGSGGGGGELLSASVTVSSAEILDLLATPKTLIAAPGAGKFLALLHVSGFNDHGGTDYAFAGTMAIRPAGTGLLTQAAILNDDWVRATQGRVSWSRGVELVGDNNNAVLIENVALELFAAVNPTLGNGGFKFDLLYREVTFA